MHTHQLLLAITFLPIINLMAMEPKKSLFTPTTQPVPSLQTICTRKIVSGYGMTNTEQKTSSAMLIKSLKTGQHKGTLCASEYVINDLQQKYIGRYGWEAQIHGKPSTTIKRTHNISTNFLTPHPTEKDLYIISNTKSSCALHIFNIITGEIVHSLCSNQGTSLCCTTTDDEKIIVSGSFDGMIKIWDINTREARHTFMQFNKSINRVAASHNNLVSMSYGSHEIKIWDLPSGAYVKSLVSSGLPRSIAMNNGMICVGLDTGRICRIDPRLSKFCSIPQAWQGHANKIQCLAISKHNDTYFYSGSKDKDYVIKKWDLRKPDVPVQLFNTEPRIGMYWNDLGITNIHETHDGKKLFATDKRRLLMWDISQNIPQLLINDFDKDNYIHSNCMSINEDETELHIGTYNTTGAIKTIVPNCTFDELCQQ